MTKERCVQACMPLFLTALLSGCATQIVVNKAKGFEYFSPQRLESAYFDPRLHEYVLCMGGGLGEGEGSERFTIRISDINRIITEQVTNLFPMTSDIQYGGHDQFYMSPYPVSVSYHRDKDKISLFALVPKKAAEEGCSDSPEGLAPVPIIRTPTDISVEDARDFKGDVIDRMRSANEAFMVFLPGAYADWWLPKIYTVCSIGRGNSCLMIATKHGATAEAEAAEEHMMGNSVSPLNVLVLRTHIKMGLEKPLWYGAVPFSLALDIALLLGAAMRGAGPGGGP